MKRTPTHLFLDTKRPSSDPPPSNLLRVSVDTTSSAFCHAPPPTRTHTHTQKGKGFDKRGRVCMGEGGMDASMLAVATCTTAFLVLCASTRVCLAARRTVQSALAWQAERERGVVIAVQRTLRCRLLDGFFLVTALTCDLTFYITFLPFLFWAGALHTARHLTMLCALLLYVGNALKDVCAAPRPDWKPRRSAAESITLVHGDADHEAHSEEYGFPSTHTINTAGVLAFALASNGVSFWEDSVPLRCAGAWLALIMLGRLYLGMHSPVDLAGGLVVAAAVVYAYLLAAPALDEWVLHECPSMLAYTFVVSLVVLVAYPTPQRPTPSRSFVVYFSGVCFGVVAGIWRRPDVHQAPLSAHASEAAYLAELLTSTVGAGAVAKRFVVGIVLVLAAREVAKRVFRVCVFVEAILLRPLYFFCVTFLHMKILLLTHLTHTGCIEDCGWPN